MFWNKKKTHTETVVAAQEWKYDSENRLIWYRHSLDGEENYYYYHPIWRNKYERIKRTNTRPNSFFGEETLFFYDEKGNLILRKESNGTSFEWEYDERGNQIKETHKRWKKK